MNTMNNIMVNLKSNRAEVLDQDEDGFRALLNGPHGHDLEVVVSYDGGWNHVSVVVKHKKKRLPTWEEMCFVKDLFFKFSETVVQYHPALGDQVNDHPYCLHLWQPQDVDLPKPPKIFV